MATQLPWEITQTFIHESLHGQIPGVSRNEELEVDYISNLAVSSVNWGRFFPKKLFNEVPLHTIKHDKQPCKDHDLDSYPYPWIKNYKPKFLMPLQMLPSRIKMSPQLKSRLPSKKT